MQEGRFLHAFAYQIGFSHRLLQKALLMIGKRRAGKGTIMAVMQELLGEFNWCAGRLKILDKEFGLSLLNDKLVAFVGEVELTGNSHKGAILETLKSIIGQDAQAVNFKHKDYKSVALPVRFVIAANEVPHFFDASRAIASRFLFLPHERSFAGQEDIHLRDKLKTELTGINNWALEGLRRLRQQHGRFTAPETSARMLVEFERDSSPVCTFIEDCLTIQREYYPGDLPRATLVDEAVYIERDKCFKLYRDWCAENDKQPKDLSYFGRDLRQAIPKIPENVKATVNDKRVRVYRGIGSLADLRANKSATVPASDANGTAPTAVPPS